MPTKVFFVETVNRMMHGQSFKCDSCDHYTRIEVGDVDGNKIPDVGDWSKITHPCEKCGRECKLTSQSGSPYYRRTDTGEILGGRSSLPPGACYDEEGWHDVPSQCGPDGRSLVVVLPTGMHWQIDSRATNCTMPKDEVHKCWVRHGKPEDGTLHVDKNGYTCAAGAGSIAVPGYHGFLHNGHLTDG